MMPQHTEGGRAMIEKLAKLTEAARAQWRLYSTVWVFPQSVFFLLKDVLKKIRIPADGSEHAGAEVLELMMQQFFLFGGDYLICSAPQ
jgi:hypothetical protein